MKRYSPIGLAVILIGFSMYARFAFHAVITSDLDFHVLQWYAKLQKQGPLIGLGRSFYNYTPPYLYLLALATLTSGWLSAVSAVKLISMGFDVYCSIIIFKLVRMKCQKGYIPFLAAAVFFAAPTVVANSAVWGQADSIHTALLLTCIYFLLLDKSLGAVVFFAFGLAFKPQAIFLTPLLMILLLRKQIPWYYLLIIPFVYSIAMWPAVILGRTWSDVLTLYSSQAGSGKALTHNAGSLYVFIPKSATAALFTPAVILGALGIILWVLFTWVSTRKRRLNHEAILLLALISVTLPPFVLPNMHDRYFYLSDAISIALAFITPGLWFLPVLFQLSSGLAYSVYLLSSSQTNVLLAGFINLITLIFLFWRQRTINMIADRTESLVENGSRFAEP